MAANECGISFFPFRCAVQISVPRRGIQPTPLQWECRVITTGPPGKGFFLSFFGCVGSWLLPLEFGCVMRDLSLQRATGFPVVTLRLQSMLVQ